MSGEAGLEQRRREKRLDEIYSVAQAGAWDNDPRATALVQCLRDLWDFREASLSALKDAERERERLREELRENDEDYAAVSIANTTLVKMLEAVIRDYDDDRLIYGDTLLRARATLNRVREALQEPAPQGAETAPSADPGKEAMSMEVARIAFRRLSKSPTGESIDQGEPD